MKLVQITGIAAALTVAACGANSKYASAQRAEDRAEEERQEAREARLDAEKARRDAVQARAEAQAAAQAQREAEEQAQWSSQRAAQAEMQADREANRHGTPRGGVNERQADRAVLFAPGSAELSPDAKARLDDIARSLRANAQGRSIVIEGYSDDSGAESANVDLSRRRADAVADYLAASGIARERFTKRGLGSRNPVSREDNDRGRALNRRVEILIQP